MAGGIGERFVPQTEEYTVGVHHLAALDESEPGIELFRERPRNGQRLLIGPVHFGERRLAFELELVEPHVMTGHLAEELVPGIEARGEIPDGLGEGQIGELGTDHLHQVHARPGAEQAVVIVHEADDAVVEALMVRHVGVGRVNADDLAQELGERPSRANEIVEDLAGRPLVALQDLFFEPRVGARDLGLDGAIDGDGHLGPPLWGASGLCTLLGGETVSRPSRPCQTGRRALSDGTVASASSGFRDRYPDRPRR